MSKVYGRYVETGSSLQTLTKRQGGTVGDKTELRVWVNNSGALTVLSGKGLGIRIGHGWSGLTISSSGQLSILFTQTGALHINNTTGMFDVRVQTTKVTVAAPAAEAGAMIINSASSGKIAWMYNPNKALTINPSGLAEVNFQSDANPVSSTMHVGALTITPTSELGVAYNPLYGLTIIEGGKLAVKVKLGGGLTFNQTGQLSFNGSAMAGDTWTVVNGTFVSGSLDSFTVNNTIVNPSYTVLRVQGLGSQIYTTDYTALNKAVTIDAGLQALITAGDRYSVMHRI